MSVFLEVRDLVGGLILKQFVPSGQVFESSDILPACRVMVENNNPYVPSFDLAHVSNEELLEELKIRLVKDESWMDE